MHYTDRFFRYLRALAALYIRMTFAAVDVYELLEPLLKDYRKLRLRNMCKHLVDTLESCLIFSLAGYSLVFMDEFVYELLSEERVCDIIMPRLIKRQVLEENGDIGPRKSRLLAAMEGESEKDSGNEDGSRSSSQGRSRTRSSPARSQRSGSRSKSRTPSEAGSRYVSRSPSRSPSRSQSRSRSNSESRMEIDGHS
jgi:pre-mRNA-splicing factor 38A